MTPAQSFRASAQAFNRQAAEFRRELNGASVRRYVGNVASGPVLTVTLSAPRATETLTENGVAVVQQAKLRVDKRLPWRPAERDEFIVVATGEVYRCRSATTSPLQAEIVCDVVRISP